MCPDALVVNSAVSRPRRLRRSLSLLLPGGVRADDPRWNDAYETAGMINMLPSTALERAAEPLPRGPEQ